jgi:pyruvate,water dikinase
MNKSPKYIRWFKEINIDDVALVGGKNASLGEMIRELTPQGIKIPNGFAITAEAYHLVLDQMGLNKKTIRDELHVAIDELNPNDTEDLSQRASRARKIITGASLPENLKTEILQAYRQLQAEYGLEMSIAVRSSATAEDLPTASFAGQQDTYLNIRGEVQLIESCQRCFASLFTDRAIHYRIDQGFDHFSIGLSIGIMKMVRSDLASSGVMFTVDTDTGFRDVVFITGSYGLGENIVQGTLEPDEFYVHKPTFAHGHRAVLRRRLGSKKIKMVYDETNANQLIRNIPTSSTEQTSFCINDDEVLQLAEFAIKIENHYSKKSGREKPMDMEWAKDGLDGELYIVQARPETVTSQLNEQMLEQYHLREEGVILAQGHAVGTKIACGRARHIDNVTQLHEFQPGEVLIADVTTPDWEPIMKIAAAIVTNRGGRTCHAAIISRELGVPAVVGCDNASENISANAAITVSCASGDIGKVFEGELAFDIERTDLGSLEKPDTKIMINLGNPELAFSTRFLPNDGVGLARLEFIITQSIKAHPMALLHPEKITDINQRLAVESLFSGFNNGADYFVQKLSESVATSAAAFWPKPVIVRLSDFKTNEYATLLGGQDFEPVEANPMLGLRGAARYTHPNYAESFALECQAMKRVRETMGLSNVKLMIPFCRTVKEGENVLKAMADHGLKRGDKGLEIYVMCEIPNNVIQIDAFAKLFDGFSIGSNDLTQLTLGVDRDSEAIAFDFDECDPGVKAMIQMVVEGAKRNKKHSGICGQAPSDHPEMVEFLVSLGIDSMSLTPDTVLKVTQSVLLIEKNK